MSTLLSMKKKLRPLNIYNLNDDNIINAELSAYATALDAINESIKELERECFVSTAMDYGIKLREVLLGCKERTDFDIQKRREILNYRNSITSMDFTKSKVEEAILNSGVRVTITEDTTNKTITVDCSEILSEDITQAEAKVLVEEFLPAQFIETLNFI